MNFPDIKVVHCPLVKDKVTPFKCKDCFFFGKEYCKQYQIEVAEDDGCTTYELERGNTNEENSNII